MPLGTKDFLINKGDYVKVVSTKSYQGHMVPFGTTAQVSYVCKKDRNKFKLEGYRKLMFDKSEIELISYVRNCDV